MPTIKIMITERDNADLRGGNTIPVISVMTANIQKTGEEKLTLPHII